MCGASYRACILMMVVAGFLTGSTSWSAAQGNKILLLGIFQDGQLLLPATQVLTAKLSETDELVSVDETTEKERRCNKGGVCFERLAGKSGARFLISGTVQRSPPGFKVIHLQIYDAQVGSFDELDRTQHDNESLEDCARNLVPLLRERLQNPVVERARLRPRKRLLDTLGMGPVESKPRWPSWRVSLATTLGLISAISLAGAIPLSIFNRKPTDGECSYNGKRDACVWNFSSLFITGYSLAAGSVVGLGLTLGLR